MLSRISQTLYKIKSKWIILLNGKLHTQLWEGNIGESAYDLGLGKELIGASVRPQFKGEKKLLKLDLIKI